ncbi:succinylglutamate-semialdehyde dehydrogenase [Sphingobium sp. DEHP117]|uniref:succinylglutamate-semialdehyde dehydrogenase n=1 Tax=Sphingobium sp. DEHP117 TaxID=2993436 RepID=UPI0027D60503|nr:succinylglutamate-semialdehyde dehydrogenase [Sphingobium sp. DEHP117]MDQ4419937.1 succinylglutamate-semialdehyde dehydrogenase [Sphingobium sp. DEHP117]
MTEKLQSFEPATGTLLWEGLQGDVDAEVERAASAWPLWAAQPVTTRMEAMRRFANAVRGREDALSDLIARETGKPLWEARMEVSSVIARVDMHISTYSERTGQKRMEGAMNSRQSVRHKPHGVVAVIGPYNFPADVPAGQIIPALIAGNAVVFKPSEKTPASGAMLVDLLHEAGVPRDAVRLLVGGAEVGKVLVKHEGVNGVLFTGSARTGIAINRALGAYPEKIVALEMGGNNPLVLWDTPDLAAAAAIIVQSAYGTSGQRCTAARRLIVKDSLASGIISELRKLIARLIVGPPHANPAPFMGPVIDNETADGLGESFMALMNMGGRPLVHLARPDEARPFLSPSLIDVTPVAQRPDIELFGPILQLVRVADFDAAIREANATRYGLSAALVGGSPQHYEQFWRHVRAGMINWNGPTFGIGGSAPFGGVGVSGNHRPGGGYAADFCAYPVTSSEAEQPRASIGIGLAPIDTSAMGD